MRVVESLFEDLLEHFKGLLQSKTAVFAYF